MDKYITVIQREMDGDEVYYFAYHPDLPGCMSDGKTTKEAEEMLADAREMMLDHLRMDDLPVPEPWGLEKGLVVDFEKHEARQHE